MNPFVYDIPVKVYFGENQLVHLGSELGKYGKTVLLVYGGGSIKRNGLYDTIQGGNQKGWAESVGAVRHRPESEN